MFGLCMKIEQKVCFLFHEMFRVFLPIKYTFNRKIPSQNCTNHRSFHPWSCVHCFFSSINHKFIMCTRFCFSLTLSTFPPPTSYPLFVDVILMFIFFIGFGFFFLSHSFDGKNIMFGLFFCLCSFAMLVSLKYQSEFNKTHWISPWKFLLPNDIKWTRYRELLQWLYDKLMLKWWSIVKRNCHKSHED